jgi:YidC/Oxa1 family membrane protein insertase
MMQKNTIVAIILTFLVIIGWSLIQSKYFPPEPTKSVPKEVSKEGPSTPERKIEAQEVSAQPLGAAQEAPKKEVIIETGEYSAVLTSDGARLKHFKLKKYMDRVEQSPTAVRIRDFIHDIIGGKREAAGQPEPVDLVNTNEADGLPLGLTFDSIPARGNWEVDRDRLRLLKPGEKGDIAFLRTFETGLTVVKRFHFASDSNEVGVDLEIRNASAREVTVRPGLEWTGRIELKKLAETDNKDYGLKYAYLKGEKVEKKDLAGTMSSGCTPGCSSTKTSIEPIQAIDKGQIAWFSFEGDYFTSMLIPPPSKGDITLTLKGIPEKSLIHADVAAQGGLLAPGQTMKVPYRVYLGPLKVEELRQLGVGAEKVIDFGFFNVVAKPLHWFLNLSHSVTRNYGIDIIILSILIKIIFLPLTQISFKSMKEMQKVQPEMARLKEIYKNDKARLQQETMLLYKRRKINPMSGCLPMLVQIPVFIALYNVLQTTFEMRHAPFFLWIRDLAAKDPIYLTPLVMGASMVIQQKMTPTAADPAQAKMFMLMPIMFTFLFLNFPSGLVLYWLVNNVLSIAHQYYLSKNT